MKRPAPPPTPDSFEERWKPRRRTIALFGITLTVVLWLGNACRPCYIGAGSVDTSRMFAGTTGSGIQIAEAKSRDRKIFYLTGRTGNDSVNFPSWTVRNGELWYWSPDDRSLCHVSKAGRKRFFLIAKKLVPAKTSFVRLYATSEGILLNLSAAGSSRRQQNLAYAIGVVFVPADDPEQAKHLPGLRDARGNTSSEEFCGRDVRGNIIVWRNADAPTETLKQNAADWIYWNYLPRTGSFVFVRDTKIGMSNGKRVLWERSSGGAFSLYGVGFAPDGDVWASEETLPHTGGVAVLAADTGKMRGWRVRYPGLLRPPFYEVDAVFVNSLKRLQDGK